MFVQTKRVAAHSSPLPPPPPQEWWMPRGPSAAGLLLSYSTHIARSIYQLPNLEEDVDPAATVRQTRRQRRRVDEFGAHVAVEDDPVEVADPSVGGTESAGTSTAASSSTSTSTAAASSSVGPVIAAASASESAGPSTSASSASQSVGPSSSPSEASDTVGPFTTASGAATHTVAAASTTASTVVPTPADVLDLTSKVLKIHARTSYFADFERFRRDDEFLLFQVAASNGLT